MEHTTQNTQQILSKKEKIQKLSDGAIKDLYTRQHLLKKLKNRLRMRVQASDNKTTIEDTKAFKQLKIGEDSEGTHYKLMRKELDTKVYMRLQKSGKSLETAYFDFVTNDKFSEKEKVEIARQKLVTTSECCGTPAPRLAHNNIDKWAEIEEI